MICLILHGAISTVLPQEIGTPSKPLKIRAERREKFQYFFGCDSAPYGVIRRFCHREDFECRIGNYESRIEEFGRHRALRYQLVWPIRQWILLLSNFVHWSQRGWYRETTGHHDEEIGDRNYWINSGTLIHLFSLASVDSFHCETRCSHKRSARSIGTSSMEYYKVIEIFSFTLSHIMHISLVVT
jgi:hypothetical protein